LKHRQNLQILALAVAVFMLFTGCGTGGTGTTPASEEAGAITITDSAGREVTLPAQIEKIAPSGPLAQIVLYTIAPNKLCGVSVDFSQAAKPYFDERYLALPKFGQFYGKNAGLNMEALMAEGPDVIFDIGEAKEGIREDMDRLQEQIGIPVVFVEATLPTISEAYHFLGGLLGEEEQAAALAAYCDDTLARAADIREGMREDDRVSVYYALGNNGLHTNARGSIHADVIEWVGGKNIADVKPVSSGAGSEISLEQLIQWDPDKIICATGEIAGLIRRDPAWRVLRAVRENQVYVAPAAPYNVMGDPPSVNRIAGIWWLGNLLYPLEYDGDISAEFQKMYRLFYHIELSGEQIQEILK